MTPPSSPNRKTCFNGSHSDPEITESPRCVKISEAPKSMPSRDLWRRLTGVGERVQGVHRSVHQTNHEVVSGAELGAETMLFQESRARLVKLETKQAAPISETRRTGREFAADGESAPSSQELRRNRVPKDTTPWAGDAHPDLSSTSHCQTITKQSKSG